jgi:hypothetical protein
MADRVIRREPARMIDWIDLREIGLAAGLSLSGVSWHVRDKV